MLGNSKSAALANSELLVDSLIGPIYYRLLLKTTPFTEADVELLLAQLLLGKRREVRVWRK